MKKEKFHWITSLEYFLHVFSRYYIAPMSCWLLLISYIRPYCFNVAMKWKKIWNPHKSHLAITSNNPSRKWQYNAIEKRTFFIFLHYILLDILHNQNKYYQPKQCQSDHSPRIFFYDKISYLEASLFGEEEG